MNDLLPSEQDVAKFGEYIAVSPFLQNPTRAIFVAKNPAGMLHIHATLRSFEHLSKQLVKNVLDAAAEKGADVIKEMLEATDARGENCLMIVLPMIKYSFGVIALFLEYCKKYADMDKVLHQRNSDGLNALAILSTKLQHYAAVYRLNRLISYFPTQKSFGKALATRDKHQRTALDICYKPACSRLLENPNCWNACCDFRSRFVDEAYDDVWRVRELAVSTNVDLFRIMFLSLKDDNLRRKAFSICVDPCRFNVLQEACITDAPFESLKFILDAAVELGIFQELLEPTGPELGNCLCLCCHLPDLRIENLRLLFLCFRKYANLPKLLQESDTEGRTCLTWAVSRWCCHFEKMELLVSYFASNKMFRKVLKRTAINCPETKNQKQTWEMLNQPGFWRKCRKSSLINFNYHALEMRDILQCYVKSGKANQKLKKILSSDNSERVKETLTVRDRKGFNLLHSLCCRTLQKTTLKIFLDAAVRVGAIKELLESQNDVNGENCLMLASGWFTVESFRLLAEFYEKHTDIKAVLRQKNDRGYDSISLVALRGENGLEFVKICLAQLASDEICREVLENRSTKLDVVLPVETKEFLEEATKNEKSCWQECRDEWLKMKDDDEAQEEDEEEEQEEEEEEVEEEDDDEEKSDAVEPEEEEHASPLKDIREFIASSLPRSTDDEHRVALEAFCDSISVIKKVSVGSVAKYEEENEEEQCQ